MDEVLDEVADDGVKHSQQYDDSDEQVESIGRQVDGVPRRGYIALKEHRPVLLSVKNPGAVPGCIHHCCRSLKLLQRGNPIKSSLSFLSKHPCTKILSYSVFCSWQIFNFKTPAGLKGQRNVKPGFTQKCVLVSVTWNGFSICLPPLMLSSYIDELQQPQGNTGQRKNGSIHAEDVKNMSFLKIKTQMIITNSYNRPSQAVLQ